MGCSPGFQFQRLAAGRGDFTHRGDMFILGDDLDVPGVERQVRSHDGRADILSDLHVLLTVALIGGDHDFLVPGLLVLCGVVRGGDITTDRIAIRTQSLGVGRIIIVGPGIRFELGSFTQLLFGQLRGISEMKKLL